MRNAGTAVFLLGLLSLFLDAIVWGVAACTGYRALGGPARRWLAAALVAAVAFVAWDQWIFAELVHRAGFPRSSGGRFGWIEAAIQLAGTLAGFRLGLAALEALRRRERDPGSADPGATSSAS